MDNFARWSTGILVTFLGLIFSPSAFAVTLDTSEQALEACIARTTVYSGQVDQSTSTYDVKSNYQSKCVHVNPGSTLPLYQCVYAMHRVQTHISTGNVSNFHYAGFCSAGSTPNTNNVAGQNSGSTSNGWYSSWVGNPGSNSGNGCGQVFNFCYGENACSSKTEFDSTSLRAPTPNGTGNVCYQSCAYSVSFWYNGTYPAGSLVYTFHPTGAACAPTDEEPVPVDNTEEPIDPETTPPLDLDPEDGGVEKPIDPGAGRDENGNGSSSGGGSCDAPPACTGESIQCNILYQTWSTRCAVTNLGDGGNGETGDNPWDGKTQAPTDTNVSQLVSTEVIDGADFLDSSGMGLSRSCPQLDNFSLNVFGSVIEIDFMSSFCGATSWLGPFMVLLGTYLGILAFLRAK